MKILLATTTYEGKKNCLDEWVKSVNKIVGDFDLLLVDNSENTEYAEYLKSLGLNVIHLDLVGDDYSRMAATCEWIRNYCIENNYDKWFSLETDVIVPPQTLTVLQMHEADWVGIPYRKTNSTDFSSEFGCSLFDRNIMENTHFKDVPSNYTHDSWFMSEHFTKGNFTKILLYNFLDIKHI